MHADLLNSAYRVDPVAAARYERRAALAESEAGIAPLGYLRAANAAHRQLVEAAQRDLETRMGIRRAEGAS